MEHIEIAREGEDAGDGRMLMPGALRFDKDEVPLTLMGEKIIGLANNFVREGNSIYCDMNLDIEDLGYAPAIELGQIEATAVDDMITITNGKLRAIALVAPSEAPWRKK